MKVLAKDNLGLERIRKGYNGSDIAEKIGITKMGYHNIEKRKNGADPKNAKKICEVLDAEFEELFEVVDNG